MFPFSCPFAYPCVCATTSEIKTKYRSGITQGYLPQVVKCDQLKHWIQITSRLNSSECSDDFACARVCVEFRFQ